MLFRRVKVRLAFLSATALTAGLVGLAAYMLIPSLTTPPDPYSPRAVAETIDSVVQPRFFKFDDTLFGMSRIATDLRVKGHQIDSFTAQNEGEAKSFQLLKESQRDYMILFYRSIAPPPNSRPYLRSPEAEFRLVAGSYDMYWESEYQTIFNDHKAAWHPLVRSELSRLKQGIPVDREAGDWLLAMRPVKNNNQCVSCHTNARPDNMLGIMVYAVRRGN